ncbi:MAG: polysaccharide deacetylase family protein [Treponema sp.]|jgi:peptidoglycan/xylan/chitin deacetylase (PgdA/CDA1 family)|nr:polysaccharide deacetylase family protein [Treponema sp.]
MKNAKLLIIVVIFWALCLFSGCQSLDRTKKQIDLPEKIVIFTFDDGPNPVGDTTGRLLDVLGKYEIHGMFALLGENVEFSPELVRRIKDEGHYIINHGYADLWAVNLNPENFTVNLKKCETALSEVLEEPLNPKMYRPQGGFYKKQHEKIWREQGYVLVPGTARPRDAVLSARHEQRVIRNIIRNIEKQGGGIIMLHDGRDSHFKIAARLRKKPNGNFNREWIPDTVEKVVLLLQEKGYVLNGFDVLDVLNIGHL